MRRIIYAKGTKNSYRILKIQIERLQTKNKTVFIPDRACKQNLPPYQHKVCAPICNIWHIVSTLLHCGLRRKYRHRTQSASCSPSSDESQRKEQLDQCPILMEGQTEFIPANPSLPSFWRTKTAIRRKPTCFGFSALFDFLFLNCPNKFPVRWTRYFFCSTTSIWL